MIFTTFQIKKKRFFIFFIFFLPPVERDIMKTCAGILPPAKFPDQCCQIQIAFLWFLPVQTRKRIMADPCFGFSAPRRKPPISQADRENKSYQRKERGIVQFSGTEGTEAHPERKRFGRDPVSFLQRIATGT